MNMQMDLNGKLAPHLRHEAVVYLNRLGEQIVFYEGRYPVRQVRRSDRIHKKATKLLKRRLKLARAAYLALEALWVMDE